MTARLHIERAPRGYVDRWRSYEVFVNGELRAELRRGETATIEVDSGPVEVFVKIDWCKSRVTQMNLDPGAEARLVCRSRHPLTALYGITFGRDNYVQLEPA
jgi:hypothetical protein